MKRRIAANRQSAGVSLFPFLAVLLCTMGALIVVLVVIARHAQMQVAEAAKRAQAEAAGSELGIQRAELEWRISELAKSRDETQKLIDDKQLELSHIEEHSRRIRDKLEALAAARENFNELAAGDVRENEELKKILARLHIDADRTKAEIDTLRKKNGPGGTSYAIIPYHGPNETRRRPIYVECRKDTVILQPEGIVLTENDFLVDLGPSNPLAAALRAVRDHQVRNYQAGKTDFGAPYPLFLIRPDGIEMSYLARAAITSWGSEFGYELIGQDWPLEFPPPDPMLTLAMRQAVSEGRMQQAFLARAAPRLSRTGSHATFRASAHGGIVQVDGSSGGGGRRGPSRPGMPGRRGHGGPGYGSSGPDGPSGGAQGGGRLASADGNAATGDGPVHSIDGSDNPYLSAIDSGPTGGGPGNGGPGGSAGGTGAGPGGSGVAQASPPGSGNRYASGNGAGLGPGGGGSGPYAGGPNAQGMGYGPSGSPSSGNGPSGQAGTPGMGTTGIGTARPAANGLAGTGTNGLPGSGGNGQPGTGGYGPKGGAGNGSAGSARNGLVGSGSNGLTGTRARGAPGSDGTGATGTGATGTGGTGTGGYGSATTGGNGQPGTGGNGLTATPGASGGMPPANPLATAGGSGQGNSLGGTGRYPAGGGNGADQAGNSAGSSTGNVLNGVPQTPAGSTGGALRNAQAGGPYRAGNSAGQNASGAAGPGTSDLNGDTTGAATDGGGNIAASPNGIAGASVVNNGSGTNAAGGASTRSGSVGGTTDTGPTTGSSDMAQGSSRGGSGPGGPGGSGSKGRSRGNTPGQMASSSSSASGSSGSSPGSNQSSPLGGSNSFLQSPQVGGMPSPNLNFGPQNQQNAPESVAKKRGERNWANPDAATSSIPIERPIRIVCDADHLTLLPEGRGRQGMRVVPLKRGTAESIDDLVTAVWDRIDSWGPAGHSMYWRPALIMEVEPGGQRRYAELQALMADSGFDIHGRPRRRTFGASAPARNTGARGSGLGARGLPPSG